MSWPYMALIEEDVAGVDSRKINIAKRYLTNVDAAARAAKRTGIPFYLMCTLLEKESMGKNIYGHDVGGVFSRPGEHPVTESNFREFYRRVVTNGERSNGVGPLQITYRGFFPQMRDQGLKAWVPEDNMVFGAKLFMSYYNANRRNGLSVRESIRRAGVKYNGASAYGDRLVTIADKWRDRVG
jgi:hypothetical protein